MRLNGAPEERFRRAGDRKRSKGKLGDGSGGMDIMSSLRSEEEEEEWGGVESGTVRELVATTLVSRMLAGAARGHSPSPVADTARTGSFPT